MVMDATCIMFDMKGKKVPDPTGGPAAPKITDYWDDAKRILNDPGKFLSSLMTYDKDNIPPARALWFTSACLQCYGGVASLCLARSRT
jgi:dynein heavy chain, axonemal